MPNKLKTFFVNSWKIVNKIVAELANILIHPVFAIPISLLTAVLWATNVISLFVACAIIISCLITLVGFSRLPSIKNLSMLWRLPILIIISVILVLAGYKFGNWALEHYQQQKQVVQVKTQPSQIKEPPTAEEIASAVFKKLPKQPIPEAKRPFFIVAPKLIFDKFNKVQSLDLIITNIGKSPANPMFGYTFISQVYPMPILITHPQSFTNDFVVGLIMVIHEPSIKMMELKGDQYVFLYLRYTDLNSKKKYSQSFYFERVIYKNGLIEYSDASSEHKREMDSIRKGNCSYIEELINSGADEKTIRKALKDHPHEEMKNINEY
ncbi:MAG: hypothetical protein ABSC11_10765 [Smithella sp.]|jgi:hypothetical protein